MEKPNHIAIIMDGNGRWAVEKNLLRIEGHRAGINAIKSVIKSAIENEIPYLTLFAFSTENWNRPKDEVNGLMFLMKEFLKDQKSILIDNEICLKTIGQIEDLPKSNYELIQALKKETEKFKKLTLTVALNYSSKNEIVNAVKSIIRDSSANNLHTESIDYNTISSYLETKEIPDPDFVIRTSGEHRLSNFLMLQSSYAEIYFSPVYWPDFNETLFEQSLEEYSKRDRRYGELKNKKI